MVYEGGSSISLRTGEDKQSEVEPRPYIEPFQRFPSVNSPPSMPTISVALMESFNRINPFQTIVHIKESPTHNIKESLFVPLMSHQSEFPAGADKLHPSPNNMKRPDKARSSCSFVTVRAPPLLYFVRLDMASV